MANIYTTTSRDRFFLVPDDVDLSPGSLAIESVEGEELLVDPELVATFEVSELDARRHVEQRLQRAQDIANRLNRFAASVNEVAEQVRRPAPEAEEMQRVLGSLGISSQMLERDAMGALAVLGRRLKGAIDERLEKVGEQKTSPMLDDGRTLWMDPEQQRFFIVPDELTLLPGEFEVKNVVGDSRLVDAGALAPFEVTQEQMAERARGQLSKVLGSMKDVARAVKFKAGALKESRAGSDAVAKFGEVIRDLFTRVEETLRQPPAAPPAAAPQDPGATVAAAEVAPDQFADLPEVLSKLHDEAAQKFIEKLAPEQWEAAALAMRRLVGGELQRCARLARNVVLAKGGDEAWVTVAAAMGVDPDNP